MLLLVTVASCRVAHWVMILHSIHEVGAPNPTGHYALIRDSVVQAQ